MNDTSKDQNGDFLLECAADIVSAYVSNNTVGATSLPELIRQVHATLGSLSGKAIAAKANRKPAVPVSKSVTHDHIICLEDGKKLKMLKRYIRTRFGLSPEEYRMKWNLPADYPMVAPAYAEQRSKFAKQIGLGKNK